MCPLPVSSSSSSQRRWHRLLLGVPLIVMLVAALLAADLNQGMWGYWIWRPAPDRRVLRASAVITVTPVVVQKDGAGIPQLVPNGTYNGPGWYIPTQPEVDYYLLDRRVLLSLERSGLLTGPAPALAAERFDELMPLVLTSGQLGPQFAGYDQFAPGMARGMVYELRGRSGERLLLLALQGGEVSNDHRAFYEFLFEAGGGPLRLLSTRRFYFDVAGFEGAEFLSFFVVFSALGLLFTVPPIVACFVYLRFSRTAAMERGLCPACRYDLRGQFEGGCPECGWGRGERDAPSQPSDARGTALAS
jgi:hypothetical protein